MSIKPQKLLNLLGSSLLLASSCACRPVITVGWQEIAFVLVLLALLLGPPIYRFLQKIGEFQNWRRSGGKDQED